MNSDSFLVEPLKVPIDINAGPLFFAGYLGGPIGALITGLIGALYVSTNGDPIPILGISMNLALPSVGLALRYLRPLQDWPAIPRVATGYILIGFAAVLIVTILLTRSLTPSNDGYQISALFALVFGTVGVVSIILTWQILNCAAGFATKILRAAEPVKRFRLTSHRYRITAREISHRIQKRESIGLLTGGVAHDFNNLLAVILGGLELIADENDPPEQEKLIESAIAATLHGADLTKNMLAFARKARLTPEVLDLNRVVSQAKNWMERTLPFCPENEPLNRGPSTQGVAKYQTPKLSCQACPKK